MKSLSLTTPHAIVMIGIPGSGKTFFAKKFAETFGTPLVSVDDIAPFASDSDAVTDLVRLQIDELLKTKQSIIVEAGGNTRTERTSFSKYLRQHGYEPLWVWVQTDHDTALQRSLKTKKMSPETFLTAAKRFKAPIAAENPHVISGKHTYASQAKSVLKRLSAPRADISTHRQPPVRPGTITVR